MTRYEFDPKVLRGLGIAAAIGGMVVLALTLFGPGHPPDEKSFATVSGKVSWVRTSDYAVRFGFEGDIRTYSYAKRSGNFADVSAALTNPAAQPITVQVARRRPIDEMPSFEVMEISSRSGMLRSIGQVEGSWASENQYGLFSVFLLWLAALNFEYWARRFARGKVSRIAD